MDTQGAIKKRRILFVDDEQKIVEGLCRMLIDMEDNWDMVFVTSGKEALARMEKETFDVVVSDMRMPEMDGAQLLTQIKKRFPSVIRFILSGYSDKDMILRTVSAADQFLTKPCDSEVLVSSIQGALEALLVVDQNKILSFIDSAESLPTLPNSYLHLRELLKSEKCTMADLEKIIEKDVVVSAKIFQLVNSSFFGLRNRIENLGQAIVYLGMETIKSIVLIKEVIGQFSESEVKNFNITVIYGHSNWVGLLASRIIQTIGVDKTLTDQAMIAGILHDVGKLILIRARPEKYLEIFHKTQAGEALLQLEKEAFGVTHAELGGFMLGKWGFSSEIVNAVSCHNSALRALRDGFTVAAAVYIANAFVHAKNPGEMAAVPEEIEKEAKTHLMKFDLLKFLPEWAKLAEEVLGAHGKE